MTENYQGKTGLFSGRAKAYALARPSYPNEAVEYIVSLVGKDAVYADIGAGTGKLSECIARHASKMYAVEPNADMRKQLCLTMKAYTNVEIIAARAESTTIEDATVDIITFAQALHWFDIPIFREECRRIGKKGVLLVSVYNVSDIGNSIKHSVSSANEFFVNPTIKEFPNPIYYNEERWLQFMSSHSSDPLPSDDNYVSHLAKMNKIFSEESKDGLLKRDIITRVYSEVLT